MLLSEFAKLTGFKPDNVYYNYEIKPYYSKSGLSKQEFCEQWVKKGGIQKAYNYMRGNRNDYKASLYDVQEWFGKCIDERDEYKRKIDRIRRSIVDVTEQLNRAQDIYSDALQELFNLMQDIK